MTKIPHYFDFYKELLMEGDQCAMVGMPLFSKLVQYVKNIPMEIVYKPEDSDYGKETDPHITLLYGLETEEQEKAINILKSIPSKILVQLQEVTLFTSNPEFDVLKIDVKSPHLFDINDDLRKLKNTNEFKYHPHVTLAYIKKGTGKDYVGDKTFYGMKFLLDVIIYSTGDNKEKIKFKIGNKKLNEMGLGYGAGGGYSGQTGGSVAPINWAGTYSSPQTVNRMGNYPNGGTKTSYMQGNTVVRNVLPDTILPQDLKHPKFKAQEIFAGLRYEMKKQEYRDKERAKVIVFKNLETNPNYYSQLGMYNITGK